MNINEASGRGQVAPLLGDSSRKEEVKRLAQSVAAEQFAAGQQQFQNGNSAYVDTARISDEALEEISKSGKAGDIERTDQLVAALQEAYQAKGAEAQQQGAGQGEGQQGGPEAAAAADGAAPGKKLQKKRTVMWEPSIEKGQIHPEGREVIGKITIKEEVNEVDAPNKAAKNTGGGASGGGSQAGGTAQSSGPASGNASGVPSTVGGVGKGQSSGNSAAQGSQQTAAQGNKEAQKQMDEEGEADKGMATAAANMKSAGVAPMPEMEAGGQGAGNYEKGEKVKEFDARTSATGATQTVSVTPAGNLDESGGTLRYFKKLDDKPHLKAVSLHSKGESFDRNADRYAQEALNQGESPDQIVQTVEQLKKTNPDQ